MHDIRFRLLEEVLVINLGDAKMLGHPISQSIVVRADEVIELPLVARNGHRAMSDLSPLSGVKRKSYARIELFRF